MISSLSASKRLGFHRQLRFRAVLGEQTDRIAVQQPILTVDSVANGRASLQSELACNSIAPLSLEDCK